VPGMFFKDDGNNILKTLNNPVLLPEETVGAEACYVVAADRVSDKVTLWITKKDWLLKRMQTRLSGDLLKGRTTPIEELDDETLKKMLKSMGQEATQEAVARMRSQMAERRGKPGLSSSTSTATYDTIAVNALLIKEDFEFSAPDAPDQPSASTNQVRPALTADQIRVEDTALRVLAAMRDKEDKVLRELATDRIIKAWPNALPQFSFELREKFEHEFGKPMALWPTESLVDGDFAVVRCTSKETETKLNGWYLGLIFYKMKDGAWRNASLAGATADLSLPAFLADFKDKNLPK
jgi:hypothetical protein